MPVTHPSVQNLAHREGMRLAGWSGLSDATRWSGFSALMFRGIGLVWLSEKL